MALPRRLPIVGLIAFLGAALPGGCGSGTDEPAPGGKTAGPAGNPIPVSASEMIAAYADGAAADRRYGNKPLLVTGTLLRYEENLAESPILVVGNSEKDPRFCWFLLPMEMKAEAKAQVPGRPITLQGECLGLADNGHIIFDKQRIVK